MRDLHTGRLAHRQDSHTGSRAMRTPGAATPTRESHPRSIATRLLPREGGRGNYNTCFAPSLHRRDFLAAGGAVLLAPSLAFAQAPAGAPKLSRAIAEFVA